MTEIIVSVLLSLAQWIFGKLSDNAEKKKKIARLITDWMKVMRKEFLASTEIAEEFEKLWAKAGEEEWKETGGPDVMRLDGGSDK